MVQVALTGLNGYGKTLLPALLKENEGYRLTAVVSGRPEKSSYYQQLVERGVRFYRDLETCMQQESIQFVVITTPMHIHEKEVRCALKHKASVYCEKPLAASWEQCTGLAELAKEQKVNVAVGFQWSYSDAITKVKRDLLEKKYGEIVYAKAMTVWKRERNYYATSDWKGRKMLEDGTPVLENVVSNATAHFLHNLLFLLGKEPNLAAAPVELQAECYRGHKIETFDTVCMKIKTEECKDIYYTATTLAGEEYTPEFCIQCEHARIVYPAGENREVEVQLEDGSCISYGSPEEKRFEHVARVIEEEIQGQGHVCDCNTALPFEKIVTTLGEADCVHQIPGQFLIENENSVTLQGIDLFMRQCYEERKLFSEMNSHDEWIKEPEVYLC